MRKIAVSLMKGGVGKTTTAINLSAGLARHGYRVLLIDTDTQGHASFMLGLQPEIGIAEVIESGIECEKAITPARERLWFLSGGKSLPYIKRAIDQETFSGENVLAELLKPLDGNYDFIILDTSPGWDAMVINVLFYATEVLAPVSLEALAIKGLAEFNERLDMIRSFKLISLNYILPTFLDRRVKKSEEILEILINHYGTRLCSPIRYNVRLSEAAGFGQTIYEYAPSSAGSQDYHKLIERIVDHGRPEKNP